MPLARAIPRIVLGLVLLTVSACAMANAPTVEEFARAPREIRTGAADMVIERVEPSVSRDEVFQAVQALVQEAPLCLAWPGIWLDASNRRNVYYARYDLMARDWGADVSALSQARMQEFVDLGFLVGRERPDLGAGVVEYSLTSDGVAYLRGSPYGGERPSFCAPSQRRVVEITSLDWGQYPCGSLRVGFTHVADGWPSWARTANAQNRVATTWAPAGEIARGEVTLGRQWYRQDRLPSGVRNGELRSVCLNSSREDVVGNDLKLSESP